MLADRSTAAVLALASSAAVLAEYLAPLVTEHAFLRLPPFFESAAYSADSATLRHRSEEYPDGDQSSFSSLLHLSSAGQSALVC